MCVCLGEGGGREEEGGGWGGIRDIQCWVGRYLFGEAVVGVGRHARGDVEDDLHVGGSVVGSCVTRSAVPLQPAHESTVCGPLHLRESRPTHGRLPIRVFVCVW